VSETIDNERRAGDRRQDAERREGQDRRRGEDRRATELGPPRGVAERRTGWDRRISDRRSGGDRRSGLDRRDPTPEVLLRAVAVQTARQLVSRLYMQVSRSPKFSERAREHLESARSELLTPRPNLERVAKELDSLKSTSVAKFPEYGLARELLRPLRSNGRGKNGKGKKRSKEHAPSLKRRDSLEQLRATLTAPLPSREGRSTARKPSASGEKNSPRRTAKKKGSKKTSTKASTKGSKKSTRKKRNRPAR
jgi:hypothetical protein